MRKLEKYNLNLLNILFCFFPVSLVLGNLAINLNILILVICAFLLFSKEIFKIKYNIQDKILFLFFLYISITLAINYLELKFEGKILPETIIFKTIYFYKYLALYLVLRFLISKKIIILNQFNTTCAISALIVLIDIYIQFFFGKNILGNEVYSSRHYSSFFGPELIAGGYLQKFSLFIFFLPAVINIKSVRQIIIQFILFLVVLFAIILSGNRMPLVLYLFSFFILLILNKKTRKYLILICFMTLFFLTISFKSNIIFKINASNFYNHSKILILSIFDNDLSSKPLSIWKSPYVTVMACSKATIKLNPLFGGGIRSYRNFSPGCSTHPHNYYVEIISDLGAVGLLILLFFIYKLFFPLLKKYYSNDFYLKSNFKKITPVFLILVLEFFPFRSSGSFFTTNNATVIFILFAILVSFYNKNYKKN